DQTLFARLAVFAGGCTAEAATAICSEPPLEDRAALAGGLRALCDKSLLRQEEPAPGEPRFRMLETIREYAHEQLDSRREIAELQEQHALYYLLLAEAAATQLMIGTQ